MLAVSTLLLGLTAVRGSAPAAPTAPQFDCEDGQGESVKLLSSTRAFNYAHCGMNCEAWEGCVAFDFTEKVFDAAEGWKDSVRCRRYAANDTPRTGVLNVGNDDERRFCILRPTAFYDCVPGEGEATAATTMEVSRAGSHQDCGRRCAFLGAECVGFDYTRKRFRNTKDDSLCRMYRANVPQLGGANPDERDYCTMIPAPVEIPEFSCEDGQGAAGEALSESPALTYDECALLCDAETHCVAFDYSVNLSVCRLYDENIPRLGADADNHSYCIMGGDDVPDHTCEPGQGEAGKIMMDVPAGSSAECSQKCDSHLRCVGFDFTETVFNTAQDLQACRLYPENTPRVGPLIGANADDRMYCTMAQDEIPEYTCHVGTGEVGSVLDAMKARSRDECAFVCEHHDDCINFDFTATEFHDDRDNSACRLYGDNTPVLGTNADSREYCELFRVEFNCQDGQGEAGLAFREARGNSYIECERRCERDARCVGFDYTAMTFNSNLDNQACRLFRANTPQIGVAGAQQRKYCARAEVCGTAGRLRGAEIHDNTDLVVIPIAPSDTMTVCQCSQLCETVGGLEWRFQVVGGQCDCFTGVRKVNTRPRTGNTRERYIVGHFPGSQARIVD